MRINELLMHVGAYRDRRVMRESVVYVMRTWPKVRHFTEDQLTELMKHLETQ